MTTNLFLLVIWVIHGILTFVFAATNGNHKVPVLSYISCWIFLIIQLILKL